MKISLIGFMGSGKSTVGQSLAQFLNLRYYEMDQMILSASDRESISEIFTLDGELRYRELEIVVAKQLGSITDGAISCGGGIIMNKINLDYLKSQSGKAIYLQAPFDLLAARVSQDANNIRPLFQDVEKARKLLQLRAPLYESYSDVTITVADKKPEDIVREIIRLTSSNLL